MSLVLFPTLSEGGPKEPVNPWLARVSIRRQGGIATNGRGPVGPTCGSPPEVAAFLESADQKVGALQFAISAFCASRACGPTDNSIKTGS